MELVESDTITIDMEGKVDGIIDELYLFVLTDINNEENYNCAVVKEDLEAEMSINDFLRVCAIKNDGNVKIYKVIESDLDYVIDLRGDNKEDTAKDDEKIARQTNEMKGIREQLTKKLIAHVTDTNDAKIDKNDGQNNTNGQNDKLQKVAGIEEVVDVEKVYDPATMNQEIIVKGVYDRFVFTMHDYDCLGSHEWLTDTIVDFVMYYVLKSKKDEKKKSIFVGTLRLFNDYKNFKTRTEAKVELTPSCIKQLESHTAGINLFEKKKIFIPILTGDHWRLMYATISEENTINLHLLCSMHSKTNLDIIKIIQLFFNRQYESQNNGEISPLEFKLCPMDVPKQTYLIVVSS